MKSIVLCLLFFLSGNAAFAATEELIDSRFRSFAVDPVRGDWAGSGPFVAQVFNIDAGKYQANIFHAFDLPDNQPVVILQGTRSGDDIVFAGDGWNASISQSHFIAKKGDQKFDLHHVTRISPTMGATPPKGAAILFDGKNLDAWASKKDKEWLVENGPAHGTILDGSILELIPGSGGGLLSHQKFGDSQIHVEFRTLGAPSNSGVFIQTRFEADINESYGQLSGHPNGNFGNCTPESAITHIRATRPPLEWQTFDIDYRAPRFDANGKKTENARVTLLLNGVKTYDQQEVAPTKGAAGRLGEAPTGPLFLQEHGMPVQFRNIWVLEKNNQAL